MKKLFGLAVAGLSLLLASQAFADATLKIGDPAPALKVANWVKGTSFKDFQKGKVYVVEFWATWCGPCKTSIPHLTELAQKFKGKATFTGVDVFENRPGDTTPFLGKVQKFVKEMGDKMNYNVATDDLKGTVGKEWMEAAGQNGIPTAFIVDQDRRIAWIGHPMMDLEPVLEKVVAKKFDVKAYAKKKAAEEGQQNAFRKDAQALTKLAQAGKFAEAASAAEKLGSKFPEMRTQLIAFRFNMLSQCDEEKATALAKEASAKEFKDDAQMLNMFAWTLVDPAGKFKSPDCDCAIAMATRAAELTKNQDPAILDTLASAYFRKGDKAKAIEIQTKALEVLETSPLKNNEQLRNELKERLATFQK